MSNNRRLTNSQKLAIQHVRQYARSRKKEAQQTIQEILWMSNLDWAVFERVKSKITTNARVALHFHPDRPLANMKSVAQALLEQGTYKSQFETRISNGSVTAYPGGARDLWEKRLFGGAYHLEGVDVSERPKYGALDLLLHADGPAPRFGSCFFLLSPDVSCRSTYTYGGSHEDPPEKGTIDEFDDIFAAMFKDAFFREFALGEQDLTPRKLMHRLLHHLEQPYPDPSCREPKRNLNHCIEAQIHGEISLADDIDILVADPSFKGTSIGNILEQICSTYSIRLFWHMGFYLEAELVPSDFRGPMMPSLAKRIAKDGTIDARVIGEAVNDLKRNPERWNDRGSDEEVLQELKYLWHVLVRFGNPYASRG